MSRMVTLFLLCTLTTLCLPLPFRLTGQLPSSLIERISQPFADEDDVILVMPRIRARRSQPIIDYTDEFSADPFEVPENAAEQRKKTIVIMGIM